MKGIEPGDGLVTMGASGQVKTQCPDQQTPTQYQQGKDEIGCDPLVEGSGSSQGLFLMLVHDSMLYRLKGASGCICHCGFSFGFQETAPEEGRAQSFQFLELFIEIGKCIEAALIADIIYRPVAFDQQLAGMTDPQFIQVVNIGLLGALLEITAEGSNTHAGLRRHCIQADRIPEMGEGVLENTVNPLGLPGVERTDFLRR